MTESPALKVTLYVEVISSWCWWAEPAWAELKARYQGKAEFNWKVAMMDASGLPVSREQLEWFYRRSGSVVRAPYMLNSGWFEPGLGEYLAPNLVAVAAQEFGVTDDRARLAIAHAAVREGQKVARWEVAAAVAARATGLDPGALIARAQSPEVLATARRTSAEFHALQVSQRPTVLIEDSIGDRAVFSGLVTATPMVATIEAMLADVAAYTCHAAHFGAPPQS